MRKRRKEKRGPGQVGGMPRVKKKSGAVSFFGAGVSPDQKNKIKIQALSSPEFF